MMWESFREDRDLQHAVSSESQQDLIPSFQDIFYIP
jgi:hypothetical protein